MTHAALLLAFAALRDLIAKHDRPHGFDDDGWYAPELAKARVAVKRFEALAKSDDCSEQTERIANFKAAVRLSHIYGSPWLYLREWHNMVFGIDWSRRFPQETRYG